MRGKLLVGIASGSLMLAVLAVAATGALQSEDQVINVCRNNVGLLRMVEDPTDCLRSETLVSWNAQGPKGDVGPAGADGTVGPQGPAGEVSSVDDFTGDECSAYGRTGEMYVVHSGFTIAMMCFVADDDDAAGGNETPETATQLSVAGGWPNILVAYKTAYPAGDVDWFFIPATAFPATQAIAFQGFPPTLHVQIYRDGTSAADLVADAVGTTNPTPFYRHTLDGQQHAWYLRITGSDPAVPVLYAFNVS